MERAEASPHLLHVFSTFAVGGPQTRFVSLVSALSPRYRHTVLAMDGNYAASKIIDPGVECKFVEMPVAKGMGISLSNIGNARRMLRSLRPNLLCTYNWGTIEWSLANMYFPVCPQIHIEDGFGPDESPQRQHRRRVFLRRLTLSRVSAVVVPSHVLEDVALRVWKLPRERVIYLPNGIDCDRFSGIPDENLVRQLGIENALVIGTVAALRPEKNLKKLVRAFAGISFSGARLVIVGDGSERAAIENEAGELGVSSRVLFTGALAEPERILGRFDVFALSSNTEQMPNAVLEAMAAALPICATDVGDVKQMAAVENAPFIVPVDDEAGFVKALMALLENPDLRARIGKANRERARAEFNLNLMVSRYDALFRKLIGLKA